MIKQFLEAKDFTKLAVNGFVKGVAKTLLPELTPYIDEELQDTLQSEC